jgi:hypothetical protein
MSRISQHHEPSNVSRITELEAALARVEDDLDRLRTQVADLLPFMIVDVRNGLALGPAPADRTDTDCEDCQWYRESLDWKARIDAGEFGQGLDIDWSFTRKA